MKRLFLYAASGLCLSAFFFCKTTKSVAAPVVFEPSAEQMAVAGKRWDNVDSEVIKTGHSIYTTSCVRCHKNYEVTRFSEEKWIRIIDKMAPKARLTQEEKQKLTYHILSLREAGSATK